MDDAPDENEALKRRDRDAAKMPKEAKEAEAELRS